MELNNFDQLVKKVTANVLQKLDVQVDPVTKDKACLVIQPNMNFGSKEYFDYILAKYPDYELYFGTEENLSKSQYMSRYKTINFITMKFDNPIFVKVLEYVNTIVVIGPKLNQLKTNNSVALHTPKPDARGELTEICLRSFSCSQV